MTGTDPKIKMVLKGHHNSVTGLSFNPNGDQFASCSLDKSMIIWNKWCSPKETCRSYKFSGHTGPITSIDYSPDCRVVSTSSKDCTVRIWVPKIQGKVKEFKAHLSAVNTVNFSPDGFKLITGSNDKSIKCWDVETQQFIGSFVGHKNWVKCAKFTSFGNLIVSCSDDHTVQVWDVTSGSCVHTFNINRGNPNYVAVHPHNHIIAVANSGGSVCAFDIKQNKLSQYYELHNNATCVDWHPKGKHLLTGGLDNKNVIVAVMEGRPLYTLIDKSGIMSCKFSPDGEYFVSGAVDNTITIWKSNCLE